MPKVLVKRSAVAAKVPATTDLDLGEFAINTNDGKVYIKKNDGTESIVEVGGGASYTHPTDGIDLGPELTGANVISDVNVNAEGHVTGFATRALTAGDIGAATSGHTHSGMPVAPTAGGTYTLHQRWKDGVTATTKSVAPTNIDLVSGMIMPMSGVIRCTCEINGVMDTAYFRVYKNYAIVNTLSGSGSWQVKNIDVSVAKGDLIHLYYFGSSATYDTWFRNLKITSGTDAPVI